MGFELTEEQVLIQKMAQDFALAEVEPIASETDLKGIFPEASWKRLAELELLSIPYPTEYGGGGAGYLSYALVIEALARSCASTAVILACHSLAQYPIVAYGTPEQKAKYLPLFAAGKTGPGIFALTEPGSGTDAGGMQTTAVLDGDHYVLNGNKCFITNGDMGTVGVVMAKTEQGIGTKGISAFIVDKNVSPWEVGKHEDKMGVRGSHTTDMIFKNCRVPKENLIWKHGKGFNIAMEALDGGRIGVAAQALGILQACLDESVAYAKERKQFGRPIADNQAIQWMIADMAKDLIAARLLVYNAASLKDDGKPCSMEASAAKVFCAEAAMRHSIKAIQIHGGYGYMRGMKVERLMRDAKITEIYEGSSEVQRMVLSRLALQ
ncbi:MAG: acyl-CoA dehydrogenase [Firmicutes bacterium]|nr:acyl-CoA dehydrogenase [Bacillota bacterium]